MPPSEAAHISRLVSAGAYAELRDRLRGADLARLARSWPRLKPLHKLVAFKLMNAAAAADFFALLPGAERYFLCCGFPAASIAPILENAAPPERRLFVQLPAPLRKRLLAGLTREALAR
jgi:Mg/Co/Ni transporter MgtE